LKTMFVLTQLSLAAALALAAAAATAQTDRERERERERGAPIAALAAAQEAADAAAVSRAHGNALEAARALLGTAADTMNPDELDAQIADRVAGFAGWVHRENGSTVMRLATPSGPAAAAASAQREAAVGSLRNAMRSPFETRAAQWDSRQLLTFKDRVFAQASVKGVIAVSINRESNRVEVTYNQALAPEEIDALAERLAAAGVPRSATVLMPGELPQSVATVGVSVRSQPLPLAAGAQINFGTTSGNFVCTLGVPATRNGVRGFVTASHCSQRVYSVTAGTTMTSPGGTFVGRETVDPAGFSCSLPDTLGCREADALFASGAAASVVDFGRVLYTNTGSLIVAGTIPVRGSIAYPTVNQLIYKTGRTTGTRSARVARTCVNALVGDGAGNTYGALCSVEVNSSTFIAGGDSGSSVFVYDGVGALITGIVSYGSSTIGGFSPWGGVTKELGALTIR
jgi:hypothetical protein